MVEKEQRTEYKYDCEDLSNEYRHGYKDGYNAGFCDGKHLAITKKDDKRDVE